MRRNPSRHQNSYVLVELYVMRTSTAESTAIGLSQAVPNRVGGESSLNIALNFNPLAQKRHIVSLVNRFNLSIYAGGGNYENRLVSLILRFVDELANVVILLVRFSCNIHGAKSLFRKLGDGVDVFHRL